MTLPSRVLFLYNHTDQQIHTIQTHQASNVRAEKLCSAKSKITAALAFVYKYHLILERDI